MQYVTQVDLAAMESAGANARFSQPLVPAEAGLQSCTINYIRTPAGGGSPAGLHTHVVDQVFYILSGTMNIEIAGEQFEVGPGSAVVFPAGVPHRNWNARSEATIHLAFQAPAPDPSVSFSQSVEK
ncbi:MAG TPA: cupin domain-containing protein [Chloroflexota bacterium]|nr:cupin domain-containing protein [Chloroflexota bacterium]